VQLYDVVNGVVEKRDKPCHADDSEWLAGQKTEDHRRQCRREERFIDTKELTCSTVHIERECNRW